MKSGSVMLEDLKSGKPFFFKKKKQMEHCMVIKK